MESNILRPVDVSASASACAALTSRPRSARVSPRCGGGGSLILIGLSPHGYLLAQLQTGRLAKTNWILIGVRLAARPCGRRGRDPSGQLPIPHMFAGGGDHRPGLREQIPGGTAAAVIVFDVGEQRPEERRHPLAPVAGVVVERLERDCGMTAG